VKTRLGRSKSYKSDTGTRFWRVTFVRGFGLRFLHLLLKPKLRLYDEHLVAVRVLGIEPLQRLKNIRGVAFRPQASSRLSRFGVYVSPVVWLSLSN
jgi:hypothetical protein